MSINSNVDNGAGYSWGYGKSGALGHGTTETLFSPKRVEYFSRVAVSLKDASCGTHHTGFVSSEGDLYTCGANHVGQLGLGCRDSRTSPTIVKGVTRVLQVSCGVIHTLCVVGIILRLRV